MANTTFPSKAAFSREVNIKKCEFFFCMEVDDVDVLAQIQYYIWMKVNQVAYPSRNLGTILLELL